MPAHIGWLPLEEVLWAAPGLLLAAGVLAHSCRARLTRAHAGARRARGRRRIARP